MSYQPPNPYSTYGDPTYSPAPQPPQSSGLGIAAMCLSIIGAILVFLMVLYMGFISIRHGARPPQTEAILGTLGLFGGTGLAFVGAVLGFIALLSPSQTNGFAAVGLTLGLIVVLGVVTLFAIGMALRPPRSF